MHLRDTSITRKQGRPVLPSTSGPRANPTAECYNEHGTLTDGRQRPHTGDTRPELVNCAAVRSRQTVTYKSKVCEQAALGSKGCHKWPGADHYGCYFSTTLPLFRQGQDLGKTLQGLAVEEGWGFADENGKRWDYCSMNNKVDFMGFVSSQKSLI